MKKAVGLGALVVVITLIGGCEERAGEKGTGGADPQAAVQAGGAGERTREAALPGFGMGIESDVEVEPPSVLDSIRDSAPSRVEFDPAPYEGAHDPTEPVSAEEYQAKMVESICLGFEACKNEEFKMAAFSLFISNLAEFELDRETDNALGMMVRVLSEETRLPTREDCELVFETVLDVTGYGPQKLTSFVDQRSIGFDEVAAGQCAAQFGRPFALCALEREVTTNPDTDRFMLTVMQHQGEIERHFAACSNVIEGELPEGARCEQPFQCAGERVFCGPETPGGVDVCIQAPMQNPAMMDF